MRRYSSILQDNIIAERYGYVKYLDLKQGISFRESIDDTTGISSKIVIDWSQNQKSKKDTPSTNASEMDDVERKFSEYTIETDDFEDDFEPYETLNLDDTQTK